MPDRVSNIIKLLKIIKIIKERSKVRLTTSTKAWLLPNLK